MKKLYKIFGFSVLLAVLLAPFFTFAASPTNEGVASPYEVLVVYNSAYSADSDNDNVQDSLEIANYYKSARSIPDVNIVGIDTPTTLAITRSQYNSYIKSPLENYLNNNNLKDTIKYIVLVKGVPMKVYDTSGNANNYSNVTGDYASVDSSTTLLFQDNYIGTSAQVANPYYNVDPDFSLNYRFNSNTFGDSNYKISYLVTRLDGYTVSDVEGMIDRAASADKTASGYFAIDQYSGGNNFSFDSMSSAAKNLKFLGKNIYPEPFAKGGSAIKNIAQNVIGYTSYGTYGGLGNNYYNNELNLSYLNGAVASTNESYTAFSMTEPDNTNHGQIAQFIRAGGSGGIGNVYEPFSSAIARESIWMPAYSVGYTWADAAYMSLRYIDWTTVVFGDPLMGITTNSIVNTNYPKVVSITSNKINGAYNDIDERTYDNDIIDIIINFSEPVTSTGNVNVILETGDTDRSCSFTINSASTANCNYVIRKGDTTKDLKVKSINGVIKNSQLIRAFDLMPQTNLDANKDIEIDTVNPYDTKITPAINSVIKKDSNLVIEFSEPVFIGSNDIIIKKIADNSIFEKIPVDSEMITGNGTNVITINPTNDFSYGVGYYVLINTNVFKDIAGNSYDGTPDSNYYRFYVESIKPDVQTVKATLSTKNSIRLTGQVDNLGSHEPFARGFEIGTDTNYGRKTNNTPESGIIPLGQYIANIKNLTCGTTYHYRAYVESFAGIGYGNNQTFSTASCN